MVVDPLETAVTRPVALTEATLALLELHCDANVWSWLVPFDETAADEHCVCPPAVSVVVWQATLTAEEVAAPGEVGVVLLSVHAKGSISASTAHARLNIGITALNGLGMAGPEYLSCPT
jgi:hypothetical protein